MSRVLSRAVLVVTMLLSLCGLHQGASAQTANEPFIGQIMCAAFNFEPKGWLPLDGRLLAINVNQALFALLGTTYGGNGQTTFALPDMRGRFALNDGQGLGRPNHGEGETGGSEQITLNTAQLPMHAHLVTPLGSPTDATLSSPADAVPSTKARTTLYAPPSPTPVAMAPIVTSTAGSSTPVPLMPPYVTLHCFIAVEGIFPSRN
jgi:microcystin-dependent protein